MSTKLIYLLRRDNNTNLPDDVYVDAKRRIGSVFDTSGDLLKGLSLDEQRRILPSVIGVSPTDPTWSNRVRKFYAELTIEVPQNGIELNISTNEEGEPEVPLDFVKFRFAANHPHVAEAEDSGITGTRYYFFDPRKDEEERIEDTRLRKNAYKHLILVCEDEEKMDQVLHAMGKKTGDLTKDQKELELEELVDFDPQGFIATCENKDLQYISLINDCLDKGVLRKVGNTYMFGDEEIGEEQSGAVRALKLKRNSGMLQDIKSKLKAFN